MHACNDSIQLLETYGCWALAFLPINILLFKDCHILNESYVLILGSIVFTTATACKLYYTAHDIADTLNIYVLQLGNKKNHKK